MIEGGSRRRGTSKERNLSQAEIWTGSAEWRTEEGGRSQRKSRSKAAAAAIAAARGRRRLTVARFGAGESEIPLGHVSCGGALTGPKCRANTASSSCLSISKPLESSLQNFMRAVQPRRHGSPGAGHNFGNLFIGKILSVAKDDHHAVLRRKLGHGLANVILSLLAQQAGKGGFTCGQNCVEGLPDKGQRAAAFLAVQARIYGDAIQPRFKSGAAVIITDASQKLDEYVLRNIQRGGWIAGKTERYRINFVAMGLKQGRKCVRIPLPAGFNDRGIAFFVEHHAKPLLRPCNPASRQRRQSLQPYLDGRSRGLLPDF